MRVGIFGGTFNPPHLGHINMCKLFLEEIMLDRLYVIPTNIPPHKQIETKTTTDQRIEMSRLAFSSISDKIIVSDIEAKRNGKSYTADTIMELKSQGYDDLYLLCGTDMLLTLDKWYKPEYIFSNVTIVYIRRESDLRNNYLITDTITDYKNRYDANILNIKVKPVELSSSVVRMAIKDGIDAFEMLSADVWKYIKEKNLYKDE